MRSLSYPACSAHAPYYIAICDLPGSTIFLHIPHKRHDFRNRKLLNTKCVLIFATTFVSNISHSTKNSARYRRCTYVFMLSARYSRQILIKVQLSRQIFEHDSNFMKILPMEAEFHSDGQVRRDKASIQTRIKKALTRLRFYPYKRQRLVLSSRMFNMYYMYVWKRLLVMSW